MIPWNKGKTYIEILGKEAGLEYRRKISNGLLGVRLGIPLSRKTRLRMSASMNKRYASGWMPPKSGRCEKLKYISPIAGKVSLDGSWELLVAKYLDWEGITWKRNTERFKYKKPNGRIGYYIPDFFVEDWKMYIEVKGYETALDRAKWRQFEAKLTIWRKKHIKQIREVLEG